ncbi:hypothetical protein AMECASPLE_021023 [Ameca splendens]|uniref:Uncharacterized protein n=1 Tax=Ameca splendens TaxID=208324 RepID=A0ABV0ZCA2_9TELE
MCLGENLKKQIYGLLVIFPLIWGVGGAHSRSKEMPWDRSSQLAWCEPWTPTITAGTCVRSGIPGSGVLEGGFHLCSARCVAVGFTDVFPIKPHVNCRSVAHLGPKGYTC